MYYPVADVQALHRAAVLARSFALREASTEIRKESRAAIADSRVRIARSRTQVARIRETRRFLMIRRWTLREDAAGPWIAVPFGLSPR